MTETQSKSIMAFDFGTQKWAWQLVSLQLKVPILPLFVMKDGIPNWDQLLKIVKEWQPDLFLVGLPLNMDDSESELSTRARKFARRLRHQTNIETLMVDERLTTREAREELGFYQEQGRAKSYRLIVLQQPYSFKVGIEIRSV